MVTSYKVFRTLPVAASLLAVSVAVGFQETPKSDGPSDQVISKLAPAPPEAPPDFAEPSAAEKRLLDAAAPAGPLGPFDKLPTGYRRVVRELRIPLSPEQLAELQQAGKTAEFDPQTRERIIHAITDYLPPGWGAAPDPDRPVDSLGRLIVNTSPGLPGWAQADVDALRTAIAAARQARDKVVASAGDPAESDGILGNFVAQAIVRNIPYRDLIDLNDPAQVSDTVARTIIAFLHYHESVRFVHAADGRYAYTPSSYPAEIVAFVNAHGGRMADVLRIDEPEQGGIAGAPSFCYGRATFNRGMANLSGQTDIWVANGFDDQQADISTGFPIFFFYDCQDGDNNTSVRVSTNGYISFFEQGGGATDGTDFTNDIIPNTLFPDGYAAPWWDDMIIATAQGTADRVSYKTEGAVDERVFTVEWFSVSRLGGDTDEFHFFQVKLYETTGVVELHFGVDVAGWRTDTLDSSTTGMENYDASSGDCGTNCDNTNNPPPPNDYRFTPNRPFNDNCASAQEVRSSQSIEQVSLRSASADGDASCGGSTGNRDIWYTFTASCAGTMVVDTCGTRDFSGAGLGPDTVISAHSACPGTAGNQLACSDDAGGTGCNSLDSRISVPMVSGQQIWVRVTHFGDLAFRIGNGLVNVHFNYTPNSTPINDDCAGAIDVTAGNTYFGNIICASADGAATCGASTGNPDIWYLFTTPAPGGTLTLDLCGSRNAGGADAGPDTVLSVHSTCPGDEANQLVCNDDGFVGGCHVLDSTVSLPLATGQRVWIRVSHFGTGTFRLGNGRTILHVAFAGLPCDDCGPGPHWIHAPACPPGNDSIPTTALAGIDTNLDCVRDLNLVLQGPTLISRSGPRDDSVNFPGLRPNDGHLDVIDTEMIAVTLVGGGATFTAGAGLGLGGVLAPSRGAIAEEPGNALLGDSFFDVFFEIDLGGNQLYNHTPLRVSSTITCVPPDSQYHHPTNFCLPLFTAAVGGVHVANLVVADHTPFPQCLRADSNCDGVTDNGDIDCFVQALLGQPCLPSGCDCTTLQLNDVNGDGIINNGDIDCFVATLLGEPCL